MPIYEYRCRGCGEIFEAFRSIKDSDEDVECPGCGEKNPQRLLSSFFGRSADGGSGGFRAPT